MFMSILLKDYWMLIKKDSSIYADVFGIAYECLTGILIVQDKNILRNCPINLP